MKKYYGWNASENRVMLTTVTGKMITGVYVYTECDADFNLINPDKQYIRSFRHGTQMFFRIGGLSLS